MKNERLHDVVKEQFDGKEMKLILYCRTRWNSLLGMVELFLKLKNCISKALRVIQSTENVFEEDWILLKDLFDTLHPVKFVLKILCSEDTTLLKVEMLMEIVHKKLATKENPLAI